MDQNTIAAAVMTNENYFAVNGASGVGGGIPLFSDRNNIISNRDSDSKHTAEFNNPMSSRFGSGYDVPRAA